MNLREKLLANHPKITPIIINGETFYIREITVMGNNKNRYASQRVKVLNWTSMMKNTLLSNLLKFMTRID